MSVVPRYEFYETEEAITLSIFQKGVSKDEVQIAFEPLSFSYKYGDTQLLLDPLKYKIIPDESTFTVRSVKVEVRLIKTSPGRWGMLVGDSSDDHASSLPSTLSGATEGSAISASRKPQKNWDGITDEILISDKDKDTKEDPNAGGDTALNSFFQKLYADADEDARRAMMKSFQESGGTTLSTNWDTVRKGKVEAKPPAGSEFKNWN